MSEQTETLPEPPAADPGTEEVADEGRQATLEEGLAWVGSKLDELSGTSVGRVEGVYVDADDAAPVWLLIKVGRLGSRSLVPFAHAVEAGGRVWVPYDRDHLRGAPRVNSGAELSRDQELELCSYFQIPEATGRGLQIVDRDPAAVTAVAA